MFHNKVSLKVSVVCIFLGIVWCLWLTEVVIFRWPPNMSGKTIYHKSVPKGKDFLIFFWKNETWHQEQKTLLWGQEFSENIKGLISQWLKVSIDESLLNQHINIESVLVAQKELFISFTHTLCDPSKSTFEKWMLLESLLKTLYDFIPYIESIRFLVHHKPMLDRHLDFSHSWPKEGYFTKK